MADTAKAMALVEQCLMMSDKDVCPAAKRILSDCMWALVSEEKDENPQVSPDQLKAF